MKRSSRLIVGLAAAALMYASLYAFVGPDYWNSHRHGHHWHYHDKCYHQDDVKSENSAIEESGS